MTDAGPTPVKLNVENPGEHKVSDAEFTVCQL